MHPLLGSRGRFIHKMFFIGIKRSVSFLPWTLRSFFRILLGLHKNQHRGDLSSSSLSWSRLKIKPYIRRSILVEQEKLSLSLLQNVHLDCMEIAVAGSSLQFSGTFITLFLQIEYASEPVYGYNYHIFSIYKAPFP